MVDVYEGWQCTGCGKIDVDRPCVGICQDVPVRVVRAEDYEALAGRNKNLESVLLRLTRSTPHPGTWEQAFKALQDEAAKLLRS